MNDPAPSEPFAASGLPAAAVAEWIAALSVATADYESDRRGFAEFWAGSGGLVKRLPAKAKRNAVERASAEAILGAARAARETFLSRHGPPLYDQLTQAPSRFLRLRDLVYGAARRVPGLVPTETEVAAEAGLDQRDKDGVEIDQGIFLAHMLADEKAGTHLCHAMLLPRPESNELVGRFQQHGLVEVGSVRLERKGKAVHLTAGNPRFLNAEDETTLQSMEVALDVAILDRTTEIVVWRS